MFVFALRIAERLIVACDVTDETISEGARMRENGKSQYRYMSVGVDVR